MPSLDRIYRVFPTGIGSPESLWASHTFGSGLATVGQQIDQAGVLYAPLSTVVLRVRYRTDINTNSRWQDEDGRYWRTNEILEVARRRWLDVSISTYDLPASQPQALVAWPEGEQPVGWNLQWRNGATVNSLNDPPYYVAELTVRNSFVISNVRVFDVLIPSPGYAVSPGVTAWIDPSSLTFPATTPGSTLSAIGLYVINRSQAALVAGNNFDAGREFPTLEGAGFMALSTGFGVPQLQPGAVITIAERA